MSHEEKITWMAVWCAKNGLQLNLQGECGFGRECVGVLRGESYPDYDDEDSSVWIPKDAYHKHPCVAVLGRGEEAESQLHDWLKWFDANGYEVESGIREIDPNLGMIGFLLGKHKYQKMVKKQITEAPCPTA